MRRCAGPVSWQELVRCEKDVFPSNFAPKNPLSKRCQIEFEIYPSVLIPSLSEGGKLLVGKSGFSFSLIQCYYPLASWVGDTVTYSFTSSAVQQAVGCTREDGVLCILGLQLCRGPQTLSLSTGEGPPGSGFVEIIKRYVMKGIERYCMYIAYFRGILKDFRRAYHRPIVVIDITQQLFIEVDLCRFAIVLLSRTISNHTRPPKSWQNGVRHCHCRRPQCGMGSRWVIGHVERWQ